MSACSFAAMRGGQDCDGGTIWRQKAKLGSRKVEILEMVVEGLSNAQIAKRLYLTESTVKQHLRAAYKALGVKNRNQAAALLRSRDGLRGAGPREA